MKRRGNYLFLVATTLVACSDPNEGNNFVSASEPTWNYQPNDSIGVFISFDDASKLGFNRKHMWVGQQNRISQKYGLDKHVIHIETSNGIVDSGTFYLSTYSVTPEKTGDVIVKQVISIPAGDHRDTVATCDTFIAINRPEIKLGLTQDHFRKDSSITIGFFDVNTGEKMSSRYQLGRVMEPAVYDADTNHIKTLPPWFPSTTIDLSNLHEFQIRLKKGDIVQIEALVRDSITDLLIPTQGVDYQIK